MTQASTRFAAWPLRAGALLLDLCIVAPFSIGANLTHGAISILLNVLAFGIGLFGFYNQGTKGQTLGKQVFRIAVVRREDGGHTGFGPALLRAVLHVLDIPVGYLWPFWDGRRQTFADKLCGTVVVRS
jgi:uncharacterized RDD family membrane protein YckC